MFPKRRGFGGNVVPPSSRFSTGQRRLGGRDYLRNAVADAAAHGTSGNRLTYALFDPLWGSGRCIVSLG